MKVCLFHPVPLPPRDYGGVERVVLWLARGLAERGHEVSVAALAGSQLPRGVHLIPMPPDQVSAADLLARLPTGTDVVHWMAPPEAGVIERLPCASLLTVHGNGKPGEVFPANTVFLSQDHARRHGRTAFVHNGIDPAECVYDLRRTKGPGLLFLSKTSWRVKNLAGAARICAQASAPLTIAGGHRPWGVRLQAVFRSGWNWAGPVGGPRKAELLAQARALLFPVLWPEPFGLVVAEALMSGTPVVASRQGSLPELLTPETGLLLDAPDTLAREQAWVAAIRRLQSGDDIMRFSSEACRARAMEHFHYLKMAEGYENAYKRVISGALIR